MRSGGLFVTAPEAFKIFHLILFKPWRVPDARPIKLGYCVGSYSSGARRSFPESNKEGKMKRLAMIVVAVLMLKQP